jgi:hypothetical protein
MASRVAGCREHYRLPGVLFASRKNRGRQVAYAHQIGSRSGEGDIQPTRSMPR